MKIGKFAELTPTWGAVHLTKHKVFEYQFEFTDFNNQPLKLQFNWTHKQDHAGPEFIFSIYKLFWICFCVYDTRHWNYKTNSWADTVDCSKE